MSLPWRSSLGILAAGVAFSAAGTDLYLDKVKPLLASQCVTCHGADQQKGGLRLDTAAAARAGGDSGPGLVPGDPAASLVVQVVEDTHPQISRMPYKKPALDAAAVQLLRQWIREGAEAPVDEVASRQVHWAFVPPSPPAVPALSENPAGQRHPVDAFIRARLKAEGLAPSPETDRVTLLRRVSLDLTGLPPTPSEVDAWLADTGPDAYERLVERLLRSPHYGERWGRWWLDVARYADSNGYSIDAPRSMWLWRDWVIDALNQDKPFDTFVIEQLAGDLLPGATAAQRIATGFHRNTQINQEGGIDPEQFRIESILDRVNTTGTVFLGLTIACAQCHDHKFDPISQREYFELFAFFNNQDEPTLPFPTPEQRAALAAHDAALAPLEAEFKALGDPPSGPDAQEPEETAKARRRLEGEIRRLKRSRPEVDTAMVLAERTEPRESYVFIKGDFTRRGPDVLPATPAILHPFRPTASSRNAQADPEAETGPAASGPGPSGAPATRLDLARWLVDPANPLTARVTVNRIWQQYFGRGLVETENDFGTQGTPPTHPELLDWLALEFQARNWSLKAIHRLIVTSATYRQASQARPDLAEKDANNRLLARQNRLRLDAEIIRDVALAASGQLNPAVGGPGVFPPQPDGVMNLGQSRREWKASEGPDRFRRGLYTFYWRATPHPALAVFDAPDAFSACTRRIRSNTPLQALTLLNDAAFLELADALAARISRDADFRRGLELAFRLCLARAPTPAEHDRLRRLFEAESHDRGEGAAWRTLARVMLNLDETITRE